MFAPHPLGIRAPRGGPLLCTLVPHTPPSLLPAVFRAACDLMRSRFPSGEEAIALLLAPMADAAPLDALLTLRALEPTWLRPVYFIDFAEHLTVPLREEALREARDLISPIRLASERARLLVRLAGGLLPESERAATMNEAFRIAKEAPKEEAFGCCHVFVSLARALPEASDEALRLVAHLRDDTRDYMLAQLIHELPEPGRAGAIALLREEVHAAVESTKKARGFRFLLENVPEDRDAIMRDAMQEIAGIVDQGKRAEAIKVVLGSSDQSTFRSAPTTSFGDAFAQANDPALRSASRAWRRPLAPQALSSIKSIERPILRMQLLQELGDILPGDEAWALVENIWPEIEALLCGPLANSVLDLVHVPFLVAPPDAALQLARRSAGPSQRAELLVLIARRLPDEQREPVLDEAFADTVAVQTPGRQAELLWRIYG